MRSAACAALLGGCLSGCLIVHADEEIVEEPCPPTPPEVLADASGAFVLSGDTLYFVGANGTLSKVLISGGPISELTTEHVLATAIDADATDLYWAIDDKIVRKPFDRAPYTIAEGYPGITHMLVDDTSVVWASAAGIERWSKAEQTITHLEDVGRIYGLGASEGMYYFSDAATKTVRRTPPLQDIASGLSPGPLVVDDKGVYFYDVAERYIDYGGAIRLVPREGGSSVTTATDITLALDLASDQDNLYFPMAFSTQYRIKQVSRFGGALRTVACGPYQSEEMFIAADGEYVYWSDFRGLYRAPKVTAL
jgi:hypothetical protein